MMKIKVLGYRLGVRRGIKSNFKINIIHGVCNTPLHVLLCVRNGFARHPTTAELWRDKQIVPYIPIL
jgi:hypothetical protein